MSNILISACLLGQKVRYDGNDNIQQNLRLQSWVKAGKVIAICPEVAGGLTVPRPAAEIQSGKTAIEIINKSAKIITITGKDVSTEYIKGANAALILAKQNNIHVAILKARSPSCGSNKIYDGTFSGKLIDGMGITAWLLSQHDIQVFDETQIEEALKIADNI